tara:strand:- start:1435 stop:1599 length:165 start_codon:yes stop_codon:yes gene_type:complete
MTNGNTPASRPGFPPEQVAIYPGYFVPPVIFIRYSGDEPASGCRNGPKSEFGTF